MPLTAARNTVKLDHEVVPVTFNLPMAAATRVFQGGMVALDAAGRAVPAAAGTGSVVGRAVETADNLLGGAGAITVDVEAGVFVWGNSGASIAAANRGQLCYAVDDEFVHLSNAGGLPVAGVVWDVLTEPAGVAVMTSHVLAAFATAGGGIQQLDIKDAARFTSTGALPAYTRTANVITATANGALPAQDGVAPAVGNRFLFRDGVAGSDNGLYGVTQLGTGATPFILTRTADADDSTEVTPGMLVHVSEGTVNADQWFYLTTNAPITLNTTALTFVQMPTAAASSVASLTTRVSTEESTRASADTSLTTRVSTEESTRASADLSLTTRVSTEESTRASADTSLTTRVSAEESNRTSGDLSLTTRVSTEESTRASADLSLTTRVSTEESTRASADTSLDTRVDVLVLKTVGFSLFDLREVDATGDVGNAAANGGLLASDTTPILRANAAEQQEVSWATANVDIVALNTSLPRDLNGAINVVLRLWVSSGATDAATFTVQTNWDATAQVTDTATDAAPSATVHETTATIDAADIPDSADFLSIQLTPAAHATDTIQLHAARLEYTSTAGA